MSTRKVSVRLTEEDILYIRSFGANSFTACLRKVIDNSVRLKEADLIFIRYFGTERDNLTKCLENMIEKFKLMHQRRQG